MSTADSAGRPARPSGAARPARQDTGMQREATRPVPTGREAVPAAGREAGAPGSTAAAATKPAPRPASSRRVKLTVSRIDPWSAMKMSFLLSVALGIALVVATVVLWTVLDAMGVFDKVNGVIGSVIQDGGTRFDILDFVGFTRVVSLSIVIAVVDVILITAIATLGAFLYNLSSALVGGVHLTLTDD